MSLYCRKTLFNLLNRVKKNSSSNSSHPRFVCGLFVNRSPSVTDTDLKVTVVGSGKTAAACAMALASQEISNNIIIMDRNENRMKGEVMDMQHGSLFFNSDIQGTCDYKKTANSKICIIAMGAKGTATKEQLLELGKKNVEAFKTIIPGLIAYSPNTILLIVSRPVDTMTYVAWKLSEFPLNRVIGLGTVLDTTRFRYHICQKLGIPRRNCQAYVIGGHDFDPVPVWSNLSLGGDRLIDINPAAGTCNDTEKWNELYENAICSGRKITDAKGDTCWGKALAVASIVRSILHNSKTIHTVSTNAKKFHCIHFDVFLSLPCVLHNCGIRKIAKQQLSDEEQEKFAKSAENNKKIADSFKICPE